LTWLIIPESEVLPGTRRFPFAGISSVLRRPVIWAQAAVIVCAYCGYKGLDNYSLYAVQVLGMDEVEGAKLATYGAYIRVVAAIAAGLLADRSSASRVIGLFFVILIISYSLLSANVPAGNGLTVIYANLFVSFFAVYGLRGVYFALLEENKTPGYLTGTAVGVVSFVGYTPDIFFAPITGRLLDATPGVGGHQHYFLFLTGVATLGVIVVVSLLRLQRKAVKDALTKFVAAPDQGVSDSGRFR
jgi:nitrate/nitrite transporter NarK